jgi:hypothetical protein
MAEGDNTTGGSNDNWLMNALLGYGASSQAGKGLKGASKIIGKTADQNIALAKDITGQNIAGYQPFAQFGYDALGRYGDAMKMAGQGDFSFYQNTPDYNVAKNAIQNAMNRSLAMKGKVLSPSDADDVAKVMADYEFGKYNDALARMRGDIGIGSPAIGSIAGERSNLASNFINQNMLKGGAQATAKIGKANIWAKYFEDAMRGYYGSGSNDQGTRG